MARASKTLHAPAAPVRIGAWENPPWRPNSFYIEDVARYLLDKPENTPVTYVYLWRLAQLAIDGARPTLLASDGFSKCSALHIRDYARNRDILAHVQPFDYQLYDQLRAMELDGAEAALVRGSVSTHQDELVDLLGQSVSKLVDIQVETGNSHFATFWDIPTATLGVTATTDGQPVYYFEPFEL